MNTTKHTASIATKAFSSIGGQTVVVSPGSRNAPLIFSFQETGIELISIVDERSAGFIALGIALSTKQPVGLCCTSGTALLNYAPAIAEAYYLGVSLVVFSADRPEHLIDQGIGQCIQQKNVFANFQKSFFHAPLEICSQLEFETCYSNMMACLEQGNNGPVHINLPFDEPLYDVRNLPFAFPSFKKKNFQEKEIVNTQLHGHLENANKILILCGILYPNTELRSVLERLSTYKQVVIMAEHTSNLKGIELIGTIDRCLELSESSFQPDVVITIGENIISKKIKSFISNSESMHYHVSEPGNSRNTFGKLNAVVKSPEVNFLSQVQRKIDPKSNSTYSSDWFRIDQVADARHKEYLLTCEFCDLKVFDRIVSKIPGNWNIHSGNSSVVRYLQLFKNLPFKYFHANRGTSGIDGSTSTAVGYSFSANEPTLLITGDLSFMYDSNGLWNNIVSPNLRIIVINNGGGGIFRIIPGPQSMQNFETFFEGNHSMSFEGIVTNLGLQYSVATNEAELDSILETFFEAASTAKVMEVQTPSALNDKMLKRYFSYIRTGNYEEMA